MLRLPRWCRGDEFRGRKQETLFHVPSPDRHECSVCHDTAQILINGVELLSDYCPNCGAKMDGD